MPCYDSRDGAKTVVSYETGISPRKLEIEKNRADKMEGVVCAILNELERRKIAENVIAEASRHGLIDIMDIWLKHKNDDISRLTADFHRRYSKDEQAVIKKLFFK